MGQRRERRARFFRDNPYCCFCGGDVAATTEDHQPARLLFRGRVWPEGFVFPACDPCNSASRMSENAIGLLIHGEADSLERGHYHKLLDSVSREYPGLISGMIPQSANEVKGILKKKGIEKPAGIAAADIPIVKLDPVFWAPHFDMFSRKLALAFHYQCYREPLSHVGRTSTWVNTNIDFMANTFPVEILKLAQNLTLPQRQKNLLSDQFVVRWSDIPEHKTLLFSASFHNRLQISGMTTEVPDRFSDLNRGRMMPPLQHIASTI